MYLAQRVNADYVKTIVREHAKNDQPVEEKTLRRFCQQAAMIEVTYCWPVFLEDNYNFDYEVFNVLNDKTVKRRHVIAMDLYFHDLFRLGGRSKNFLAQMRFAAASHSAQIRWSICLFNIPQV